MAADKTLYAVIAVIAVACVAGAGAYVVFSGHHDKDESTTPVLIMDQYGVYQLVDGSGDTVTDALKKASDNKIITVDIQKASWGNYLKTVNGLSGLDDNSQYWTLYTYDDQKWTLSKTGMDNVKMNHAAIGWFYMEYDQEYKPVKGGPELLKDKIPALTDKKWNGSKDGVLFDFVSGTGFTTYANGTYDKDGTVWDAFKNATTTYNIPFEAQGVGIATLYGVEEWNADVTYYLYDDYENQIATYWQYWMQYIKDGSQWVIADKTMDNYAAKDNPEFMAKVSIMAMPNESTDVQFTYDKTAFDIIYTIDGQKTDSITATTGSGVTLNTTVSGQSMMFDYVTYDGVIHNCVATAVPHKGTSQMFSFINTSTGKLFSNGDKVKDGLSVTVVQTTIDQVAQSIIDNYTGDFGKDYSKFVKSSESTAEKIILNGNTHSQKQYYIEIGTAADPAAKLDELKDASDGLSSLLTYSTKAGFMNSVEIVADTNVSNFFGIYYNFDMDKGSCGLYFGFSVGNVYVSAYGDADVNGLRCYGHDNVGVTKSIGDIQKLFDAIFKGTNSGYSLEINKEQSFAQSIANKYNATPIDQSYGSFGAFEVKDGKLYSEKADGKEYGPMVFVVCDNEAKAKEIFDKATGFAFADVLTAPSEKAQTEWGWGEVTATEQPGSKSKVYTDAVGKLDGFHGFYVTKKMGDSQSTRLCFIAYMDNVYISSAHSITTTVIDDTGSDFQYIGGAGTHIDNTNLGQLLTYLRYVTYGLNGALPPKS